SRNLRRPTFVQNLKYSAGRASRKYPHFSGKVLLSLTTRRRESIPTSFSRGTSAALYIVIVTGATDLTRLKKWHWVVYKKAMNTLSSAITVKRRLTPMVCLKTGSGNN